MLFSSALITLIVITGSPRPNASRPREYLGSYDFSSISGHRGAGGISYDAAKAGIIRATQTMANALGEYGIRVNSISPGTHKTEMNRDHWENETDLYKRLVAITPLRRAAEAKEIAGTVIYLSSDQSSFTTGADILVDGGYLTLLPGREKLG